MQLKKTHIGNHFSFINEIPDSDIIAAHAILVKAYASTEEEIWGKDYARIEPSEFQELANKKELIIAKHNNSVVGTIHFSQINTNTYSFGLFAVDTEYKGIGVGKSLIEQVEKIAVDNGAKFMNLEILRPTHFQIPFKLVLQEWYLRLGYAFTHSSTFIEHKPNNVEKAKKLIVPATFDCFQKILK